MSNISYDLSGKINSQSVAALSLLKSIADSLGIPFFVVGASARDYILEHCYGIKAPRMTMDIDLGVEVGSWEQFNKLTEALKATGKFVPDVRERQRFNFDSLRIDIVPFGPIADARQKIAWPPEHVIFMSMLGFREAYEYSITIRLSTDPELDIKLPTLPGLVLMKLISWHEKYPLRKRDADDLLLIMQKYEEIGNFDRLYGEEKDLLQDENFDLRLAGIRLLGRDMAKIADPDTLSTVKGILAGETEERAQYRLIRDMIRGSLSYDGKFDEVLLQVQKLEKGLLEVIK